MKTRKDYQLDNNGMMKGLNEFQHTPTPWIIKGYDIVTKDGWVASVNQDLPEDAAFIVRAVNSHEELLKLAKIYHQIQINTSGHFDARECCFAAEVIAKAEGK